MPNELIPVKFHEDTIYYTDYNGEQLVPMRPVIENMGLSWQAQHTKLLSAGNRWSVTMIMTVAQDGRERDQVCIPLRKLSAFLATINPDKVREDLRDKLIQYQEECDEVLWQYWTKGHVTKESVAEAMYRLDDRVAAARIIFETAHLEGNQLTLALDKVYRSNTGQSALDAAGVALVSPKNELALTPTQIGEQCNPVLSPRVVNTLLEDAGYQRRIGKNWQPCDKAAGMYELLDVNKAHSTGTPIKQLKWYLSIVPVVRKLAGQIKED